MASGIGYGAWCAHATDGDPPGRRGRLARQVLMARMMSNPFPRCPACGGSLQNSIYDPGWLKCFACSRSFEAHSILGAATIPLSPPGADDRFRELLAEFKRKRGVTAKSAEPETSSP